MTSSRTTPLAAMAACGLLLFALPAPAAAQEQAEPETAPEAAATSTEVDAPAGSIAQTWDDDRRAAAEPVTPPTITQDELEQAEPAVDNTLEATSAEGELPAHTEAPAGAFDGEVFQNSRAERWHNAGSMPARTVGKLYFTNDEGNDRSCTASVITADNRNTVWTAGHCLHSGEDGDWFTDVHFIPDHDDGAKPLGEWEATRLVSARGWTQNGDLSYDLGAVELNPQPGRGDIQGVTGSQGYRFGHGQDFDDVTFFGYPGAGFERDDFDGTQLWYCENPTERKGWFDDQIRMDCDMHSGSSGGPWLNELETDRGWGYIVTVMSHRTVDSDTREPIDIEARAANHGDAAINVYEAVSG